MKKWFKRGCFSALMFSWIFLFSVTAMAQGEETIKKGIYAGDMELSGMSAAEAEQTIRTYVDSLRNTEITLIAADNKTVTVTADELGLNWANPELVEDALAVGVRGNVIERYKKMKDLERENLVYPVMLSFDIQKISDVLIAKCAQYDVKAVPFDLIRENQDFRIVEGRKGYSIDVETSIDKISHYLTEEWDRKACAIALDIVVVEPKGSLEELSQVKDVLGSFTTSYTSSNFNRSENVSNGCNLIDGVLLYPGDEFSMYEKVAPFSVENGYYMAGSYMGGRVVDSLGGGICQVSTTLYNAVLQAELEVTERHNHSMIVNYVEPSADAAIAESAGKDFKFVNNLEYPVYIEGITQNKHITFNIYGRENRASNREDRYESKVLEVNHPTDIIYADATKPLGYIVADSAHIGYRAQLWKVVLEDGKEVSRTQVNSSSYKMVPRSATVGTATEDPQKYEEIMAAIGTSNVDHVRNVITILTAPPEEDYDDDYDDEE